MPLNQLQRTDSWPPTVLRLSTINESKEQETDTTTLRLHNNAQGVDREDIDNLEENPFSYFLSSPEDSDDDEDLNAGIENPNSKSILPIIRTVSPSDFQHRNSEEVLSPVSSEEDYIYDAEVFDDDAFDIGIGVPLTLREFSASQSHESRPRAGRSQSLSLFPPPPTDLTASSPAAKIKSHVRGRNPVLHRSNSLRRLRADTYPVRRPHSWRRPSDDVWTIPEESSGSGSNSSKESLDSSSNSNSNSKSDEASSNIESRSSPNLTLAVPIAPFDPSFTFGSHSPTTPPPRLGATLEGEDPSQISVWDPSDPSNLKTYNSKISSTYYPTTAASSSPKPRLYSALGSPINSSSTTTTTIKEVERSKEEKERSLALARVTVLEEAPFPPEPVLRLPLRRRKTVRFVLPGE